MYGQLPYSASEGQEAIDAQDGHAYRGSGEATAV